MAEPSVPLIRPVTVADRDVLIAFHEALYVRHRMDTTPAEILPLVSYAHMERVLREDVASLLRRPGVLAFLAEDAETPVGYVTGHIEVDSRRTLARKGVVEDWYVVPSARGTGVGRALLETMLSAFRDDGCVIAESATWPGNHAARRIHGKAGFVEIEVKFRRSL